jgi:hypothetical protein
MLLMFTNATKLIISRLENHQLRNQRTWVVALLAVISLMFPLSDVVSLSDTLASGG